MHEGQAGFRRHRSCIGNAYTLNKIVQGRLKEGKPMYAFFLDVSTEAYNTAWHDGLWLKLWDNASVGVKGKTWHVVKGMLKHLP